jgi:hypothetical protein
LGGAGDGQVAEVGRVEAASEEGDAHGDMVANGAGGLAFPQGLKPRCLLRSLRTG